MSLIVKDEVYENIRYHPINMAIYPTNLKVITHQLRNILSNICTIQGEVF